MTIATLAKMTGVVVPRLRNAPAVMLPATTKAENTAWERVMTRLPDLVSAKPARELIATSAAPEVAPSASIARDAESASWANMPTSAAATPTPMRTNPATRGPHRSTARPDRSMAGRAPTPTNTSATPNWASSSDACSRSAGRRAPHVPQKGRTRQSPDRTLA
jgi:hypothetical protein